MRFNGMPARKKQRPKQTQARQPGREYKMRPRPQADDRDTAGSGKLKGKIAIITGGDSGIGRAVAIAFAKEGAALALVYLNEHRDAKETQRRVAKYGAPCLLIAGDVGREKFCQRAVQRCVK